MAAVFSAVSPRVARTTQVILLPDTTKQGNVVDLHQLNKEHRRRQVVEMAVKARELQEHQQAMLAETWWGQALISTATWVQAFMLRRRGYTEQVPHEFLPKNWEAMRAAVPGAQVVQTWTTVTQTGYRRKTVRGRVFLRPEDTEAYTECVQLDQEAQH